MSPANTKQTKQPTALPPSRRLVRLLAATVDCHERTALRALVYGPDAIHGYALRDRLRAAIAGLPPDPVQS